MRYKLLLLSFSFLSSCTLVSYYEPSGSYGSHPDSVRCGGNEKSFYVTSEKNLGVTYFLRAFDSGQHGHLIINIEPQKNASVFISDLVVVRENNQEYLIPVACNLAEKGRTRSGCVGYEAEPVSGHLTITYDVKNLEQTETFEVPSIESRTSVIPKHKIYFENKTKIKGIVLNC